MTVLVTGGNGFIGMNLVESLLERGEEVVILGQGGLPPGGAEALDGWGTPWRMVDADVRDREALDDVFGAAGIDKVFHGAVITAGVDRERRDVHLILDVNLQGTVTVLEATRDHGVDRIVFPSSNSVYGDSFFRVDRLQEDSTPPIPNTIYGVTKYAGERISLRLAELWGLNLVCARIGSVFGPWERATGVRDLLSPHFQLVEKAATGREAILPPHLPDRDWVYSRDIAGGLVALLESSETSHRVYNLGSGHPGPEWACALPAFCNALEELFPEFRHRTGTADETTITYHDDRDRRGVQDITRMVDDLGYAPRFGPAEAFADYARWIGRHRALWG